MTTRHAPHGPRRRDSRILYRLLREDIAASRNVRRGVSHLRLSGLPPRSWYARAGRDRRAAEPRRRPRAAAM